MSNVDTSLDDALVQLGRPAHTEGRHVNMPNFGIGVSWGRYESLVLPVKPQRSANSWNEAGQLVRFNIGLEDLGSLKRDLSLAFPHLSSLSE